MNLAGNPFALLHNSKDGPPHLKYEWERQLPNGKMVTASWEVNGHTELGLPGPSDEMLYLVLLQITREAAGESGAWPQRVYFSRYDLIRRLGMPDSNSSYKQLRDCLTRLASVNITANHSFWDARLKTPYVSVNFGILNESVIADEPRGRKGQQTALPLSWFEWNSILHASFTSGNVRDLALDFVISLDHPTTRRLFRFLDMHRKATKPARREFTIGVMKLRDRMGMANYRYVSKVKEKLASAHEELIERGYLNSVEYVQAKSEGQLVIYRFREVRVAPNETSSDGPSAYKSNKPEFYPPVAVAAGPRSADALRMPVKAPLRAVDDSEQTIYPNEAFAVFTALPEAEQEKLRQLAREAVEPAFWDRLERPDSPMALVLWELVVRDHNDAYLQEVEK